MDEKESSWKYTPDEAAIAESADNIPAEKPLSSFSWKASNSPINQKNAKWYIYLTIITAVIAAAAFFLTKDKITTAVIIACGILFGIYAARKPKEIEYSINDVGFTIGPKEYNFANFKSFSVLVSGDHTTVSLTPLKRFLPYLYINFASVNESKVTAIISQKLPLEKPKSDPIDRFMRYIGF